MGVADLRNAFNEIARPRYTCSTALSHYEPTEAGQFQVLTFSGRGADGNSFEVKSEAYPPNLDPVQIARQTAQALLDKQEPLS